MQGNFRGSFKLFSFFVLSLKGNLQRQTKIKFGENVVHNLSLPQAVDSELSDGIEFYATISEPETVVKKSASKKSQCRFFLKKFDFSLFSQTTFRNCQRAAKSKYNSTRFNVIRTKRIFSR